VLASTPEAVITTHQTLETGNPVVGWYGCLKSDGKQRLLTSAVASGYAGYYTDLLQVAATGTFVALAFSYTDKYFDCYEYIDAYDLRTGKPGQVFTDGCSYPGTPSALDSLSINASGFIAWR
jgi:hypothetical protein